MKKQVLFFMILSFKLFGMDEKNQNKKLNATILRVLDKIAEERKNNPFFYNPEVHENVTIALTQGKYLDIKTVTTENYSITIDARDREIKIRECLGAFKKTGPFTLSYNHPQYNTLIRETNNIKFIKEDIINTTMRRYLCFHADLNGINTLIKNLK